MLRGEKLVVDLTSGVSRVESGKTGQGRVQGLFQGWGLLTPKPAAAARNSRGASPRDRFDRLARVSQASMVRGIG